MENEKWNKFLETGRVNDYLDYKLSNQKNPLSSDVSLEKGNCKNENQKDNNAENASFTG